MRLRQYINETKTIPELKNDAMINKTLHSKCKYYLSLIKGETPLYRGMSIKYGNYGIRNVRQNRKSLGMDQYAADKLNEWLKKHGHTPRNKSIFAISDYDDANNFGIVYAIFPVGKFNYTWIEATDINVSDFETGWDNVNLDLFEYYNDHTDKERNALLKYFNTNKGFYIAQNKGYEIWMDCKEYYYFNIEEYVWFKDKQMIYKKTETV